MHYPSRLLLIGVVLHLLCGSTVREVHCNESRAYRLRKTSEGIEFGIRGQQENPRPVAFLFGSLRREALTDPHCEILLKLGYACVALDLPGHGSERVSGEPPELRSWRHRLLANKNFVRAFNRKLSSVLDHLIRQRIADPQHLIAVGGSRGGFIALHFAASDARLTNVAALAPVTDLSALSEFMGMKNHQLTKRLAAIRLAGKLAGRNVLVTIGDRDARVGTDHAIAFARQVSRESKTARVALHVLAEPRGHVHPPGTRRLLAAWAQRCLGTPQAIRSDPRPFLALPVMGKQQLFAYPPHSMEIFIKEPRHVAEPSDWPANLLRFQFPESITGIDGDGARWEFNFEKSNHPWRIVRQAKEKTMGGTRKNKILECEDRLAGQALIRRRVIWGAKQLDFELTFKNLGSKRLSQVQTSMCMQRTAAPAYYDPENRRTFLISDKGFLPSSRLAFHPHKLMFYGQVGSRLTLTDKSARRSLKEAAIFVASADKRYVLCYAWRDATMVFMNRSGRVRCIHSELRLTGIAPQQTVKAKGMLFVQKGTLKQAYQRFLAWKNKK